jgi:hypothetical protein
MSTAFETYCELLSKLHVLMTAGKGDDEEADEIRDAMDKPWYELTKEEQKKVDEISVRMYEQEKDNVLVVFNRNKT